MVNPFLPRSIRRLLRAVITAIGLVVLTKNAPAQEFRAAWADIFHNGLTSSNDVSTMVSTLVSGNYNVVIAQVLGYMDNSLASHGAHWQSSIVPWSSRVTPGFDPLATLCQLAHTNGIEVHAWLGGSGASMYRVSTAWPPVGNATLSNNPAWFIAPYTNSEQNVVTNIDGLYALDMGSPDVQEYIVSIVRELVTNYPIDGINWDDEINTAGYNVGFGYPTYSQTNYARSGLARFRINTGFVGTPANTNVAWSDYRRRFKNELMARVQAEIQSIKTNPRQPLRHTSAAMAYGLPASCNFTNSTPYSYFCDWVGMLRNGWVDAVVPQTYSSGTFNSWANLIASCWQYDRQIFPGIGAFQYTDATIASEISYSRSVGLKGNATYSYAVPNSSNNDWWAYAVANVYTNVLSTPTMSWRNTNTATEGIVWGRVKDDSLGTYVDDATVTVTGGPTVRTDGNGYYVATLVPATAGGTSHLTTASKGGAIPQSTNALALPGDIVRYDLLINVGVPAPPSNLTATALSSSQIKLLWTDRATNETAYVLARATVSGGPYSDIVTLSANSTTYTNNGLTPGTAYYYVVRATNSVGVSFNSAEASALAATNQPPAITIQPQTNQIVLISNSVNFSVTATGSAPLNYQWRFNGVPIPGANSSSFSISAAAYGDSGIFSVAVSNSLGSVLSSNATLTVLSALPSQQFANLWKIQAGSRPYVTSNNTERGLCINPLTGHDLLVSRSAFLPNNLGIFVLDANSGTQLGTLSTNGISSTATFILNKIDAADDGVIYAANLTTSSATVPFVIYRWANEGADPTVAYSGQPDSGTTARWGDSFSVTGSGANTRILISGSVATTAVLFTTTDGTNFSANVLNPVVAVSGGEFARGLFLVGSNSFYVKNRSVSSGKLYSYDVAAHTCSISTNISPLDVNMLAIAVLTNYNYLAGVVDDNSSSTNGHMLRIQDISNPTSPTVISNINFMPFGSGTNSSNSNIAGSVDTDGSRIVALDTQNGIVSVQFLAVKPRPWINALFLLPANLRDFRLNADPGNFVMQASSDQTNWVDLTVTRTNGLFEVTDPGASSGFRVYRTKN